MGSCVKQRLVALAAPCLCVLVYSIWLGPTCELAFFGGVSRVCQSCMHVEAHCAFMPPPLCRANLCPTDAAAECLWCGIFTQSLCTLFHALCHSARYLSCFAVEVVTLPVCHPLCVWPGVWVSCMTPLHACPECTSTSGWLLLAAAGNCCVCHPQEPGSIFCLALTCCWTCRHMHICMHTCLQDASRQSQQGVKHDSMP